MNKETTREILDILARDSRAEPQTIAQMLGDTEANIRNAIKELETQGIIKRYSISIDWEKAGYEKILAFVDVKVLPAREVGFDAVAFRIAQFPEVRSAWLVSGGTDLRVLVETYHLRDLANFVAEKIATIDGVTGTSTQFLLRTYKEDHVLFQEPDTDNRLLVSP